MSRDVVFDESTMGNLVNFDSESKAGCEQDKLQVEVEL